MGWYWELLLGVAVMMVVLTLTLTVFLILYGHIFALPLPWQGKIALMAVLLGVVLWGRKRIAKQVASISSGATARIANRVANDKSLTYGAMANPVVAIRKADRAAAAKVKESLPLIIGAMTGGIGAVAAGGLAGKGKKAAPGGRTPEQAPPLQDPPPTTRDAPPSTPGPRPGGAPGGGAARRPEPPPLRRQLPPSDSPPGASGPQAPPGAPGTPSPSQGAPRGTETFETPLGGRRVVIHRKGAPPISVPRDEVIEEIHRPAPEQAPPLRRTRIVYDRPLNDGTSRREDPPRRQGDPPPRT